MIKHKGNVLVVGGDGGAWSMRGKPLARLGYQLCHMRKMPPGKFKTIILIKWRIGNSNADEIRRKCDRLIYDPLDAWSPLGVPKHNHIKSETFWKKQFKALSFDDIIGTSPACVETMKFLQCSYHMIPHTCDHRLRSERNENGPIVYCGDLNYINHELKFIKSASSKIGKKFITTQNPLKLHGASLALCVRLKPYNTDINNKCKPQVKLENAAASGLPAIGNQAASFSLKDCYRYNPEKSWESNLSMALNSSILGNAFTQDKYLQAINEIVKQ